MYRQKNMVCWFQGHKETIRKIGSRYTKMQYSSIGNEVEYNVEVIGHLLSKLTNLSFVNGLVK